MTVQLKDVDLGLLAQAVDADGFSASGLINGMLPVVFTKRGIIFKDGTVTSTNGSFEYAPATFPPALQGDDVRMETVRKALSDFRYESLEIGVTGDLDKNLKTTLKASGKNPVFEDRPINLNINLEGALVPAVQQALQPGKFADKIEKSFTGDRR